ncbi:sensor histidine kinase [Carboxylicivirga sp. M1479]|uniref:sensor histidine kinase n=1 Tax=Carboxylicivirga sp. M1479 TaxID=2594476 RepID=UPI001177B8B5|nr:histidine kinase [Carboxylicivirga sp. M1479]TRX65927.1 histidine kinase [Carboxylicivirga sp. M1479]
MMKKFDTCYNDRFLKGKPILFVNYKTRFLFEFMMGVVFYMIITFTLFVEEPANWRGFAFTVWLMFFISEGIFAFNKMIACKHPWHSHTRPRVLFLVCFSIIWFILAVWLSHYFKPWIESEAGKSITEAAYNVSIVIAILFVTIYVVLLFSYNYHQSLSVIMIENERLQQDKLKQDYRALQDQINPHFLFNNLSTLIAIIRQDKEAAIRFANNFSDVYRYVLQSNKHTSIKLSEEINFMKAFGSLHKERLRDGLVSEADIAEKYYGWHLPPLSLQLLVENAVKHNVATKASPLKIKVYTENDFLVVWNSINPKDTTYSTNTGLSNLKERYQILTDKKIKISHTKDEFKVELPLIEQAKF